MRFLKRYNYYYIDSLRCNDTSECHSLIHLPNVISELETENNNPFQIHPNPFNLKISIKLKDFDQNSLNLTIRDLVERVVFSKVFFNKQFSDCQFELNISKFLTDYISKIKFA